MPLEDILQALEAEAERQVTAIEQAAQAEVERRRAGAQAEAVTVRQQRLAAVQAPLQAEQARIVNQAKLEALRLVMGTRETLIASALEAAARRLAALSTTAEYTVWLQRLTQEAVARLGRNGQLWLRVRSHDVELLRRLVQELGLSATVEGGLESEDSLWGCLGGVVATTLDGRISLSNTLAGRLRRVASLYRSRIAAMVCGNAQEG
jgi:vacuolar-type H+-ATPase subunit E/Vma4